MRLAEYLNADKSVLTRELNLMKEEGFIDFEKNLNKEICRAAVKDFILRLFFHA